MKGVTVPYMLQLTHRLLVARSLARRGWHRRLTTSPSGTSVRAAAQRNAKQHETALPQGALRAA